MYFHIVPDVHILQIMEAVTRSPWLTSICQSLFTTQRNLQQIFITTITSCE